MIHCLPVRTPTLPPATHTNVYRVGRCVIDAASPYPDEQARTLAWVLDADVLVDTLIVTHHHADHVGGVVALRDALTARGVTVRTLAHPDAVLPFALDGTLNDGDSFDTGDGVLTMHHTPGHADGHLALLLPDGQAIVGDLVAGVGTILVAPPEGHLGTYLSSLRRIAAIATRVYPAHGDPQPPEILRQYLMHRAMRTEQVRLAREELGPAATALTVAERVYQGVPGVDLAFAAMQVAAILIFLDETHA